MSGIIDISVDYFGDEKNIVIPDSAETIPMFFFRDCDWIESVYIPDSVKEIGEYAFEGCTALKRVRLSPNIEDIALGAFKCCESLSEIDLPEGVRNIGDYAFNECKSLSRISFPDTLVSIGESAFGGCELLESLEFPESLKKLGELSFFYCCALMSVTFHEGIKVIGNHAFANCSSLQSISIPDSVTHIECCAFSECTALSEVNLGSKVIIAGVCAFENTDIKHIVIPASLSHLDSFSLNCPQLEDVYFEGKTFAEQQAFGDFEPRLISPQKCIADWEYKSHKRFAARGFAKGIADGIEFPPEVAERNRKYISSQRKKLYDDAINDEYLIEYMVSNKLIPLKDVDMLLEKVAGNTVMTALLLHYKSAFSKKQLDPFANGEYEL